jgi:hypothetical protein
MGFKDLGLRKIIRKYELLDKNEINGIGPNPRLWTYKTNKFYWANKSYLN